MEPQIDIALKMRSMENALRTAAECIKSNKQHLESMGRHCTVGTSQALDEIANVLRSACFCGGKKWVMLVGIGTANCRMPCPDCNESTEPRLWNCSALDALDFAIELCDLRKSATRTPGWNAACDDLAVFLQAARERLTANLPLREYATTQNAEVSHGDGSATPTTQKS